MNKEILTKLLEEHNKISKEYLEEYLKSNEEAKIHFPTIEEYDNCVSQLDDMFQVRIYDLAIYNITNYFLKELNK